MTLTAQALLLEPVVSYEPRQRVQFDAEHDQAFGASRPSLPRWPGVLAVVFHARLLRPGPMFRILVQPPGGVVTRSRVISAMPGSRRARHHLPAGNRGRLSPGRRGHQTHVDYIESQAVDPLDQAGQGAPIRQLGPEGSGAGAYGDLAIVELRAERGARLPEKRDLICL